VLRAISWAQQHGQRGDAVLALAEQRLQRPAQGWLHQGQRWQVLGLSADGGLRLERGGQRTTLLRQDPLSPETRA
jgi:hypothetical protein